MKTQPIKLLAPLTLALVISACGSLQPESSETDAREAELARQASTVKFALLSDEDVASAPIQVTPDADALVLSGFVDSEEERERALEVARDAVVNVDVVNRLEIR